MGGGREVSIISHRSVPMSDLKQERSFFRGSVSTFLQLVVAICVSLHHVTSTSIQSRRFVFHEFIVRFIAYTIDSTCILLIND